MPPSLPFERAPIIRASPSHDLWVVGYVSQTNSVTIRVLTLTKPVALCQTDLFTFCVRPFSVVSYQRRRPSWATATAPHHATGTVLAFTTSPQRGLQHMFAYKNSSVTPAASSRPWTWRTAFKHIQTGGKQLKAPRSPNFLNFSQGHVHTVAFIHVITVQK